MDETEQIDRIRLFNRAYTRRIGVLDEGLLDSPFSLTEARILFEIATAPDISAGSLGGILDLDAGYLSRTLKKLEQSGLVVASRPAEDGRRRALRLTAAGESAFKALDAASRDAVAGMLGPLGPQNRLRLVAAADTILACLAGSPEPAARLRAHQPGDMGWIIERHGALYAAEYDFDARFEALVAEIAADFLRHFDPARSCCLIAARGDERLGSAMVVDAGDGVAKLRLVLVEPQARGLGLGRLLLEGCLDFARQAGYRRMTLWTNSILTTARQLYETAGFQLVDEAEHSDFGPRLIGQSWTRDL
ncbi:MarR family winged helix-turn-helix transcriptional regulator [Kaistia dalseonensis]|nr:MarR family winged helix-turn-helix transcriptional regulator [Kaistia dalseonensis]